MDAATLYDLSYAWKDYRAEALRVVSILNENGCLAGSAVVELACGTGRYLEHLQDHFVVSGVDIDADMLTGAQWRAPRARLLHMDMRDVQLDEPVDAVLCLFGGVGYLAPGDDLVQGLVRMRKMLKTDGVLLVEPWVAPAAFEVGNVWMQTYSDGRRHVARMVVPRQSGRQCVLDFHFQTAVDGAGVENRVVSERLWLHTREELTVAMEQAGLSAEWTAQGFLQEGSLAVCTPNPETAS